MEVVAPFGFAISVVQARTILISIKKSIDNFRKGPWTFQALTKDVDLLDRQIVSMKQLLEKVPSALPSDISASCYEEFASVGENLEDTLTTMERYLNPAFAGSSTVMGNISSKRRQTLQATELTVEMDKMKLKIDKVSNQLQRLISALASAIKADESTAAAASKIDEGCDALESKIDSIHVDETEKEVYSPGANTPAPSHIMVLDFSAKDEKGNSAAPEGVLRQSVLHGEASQTITAVTGSIRPAYGVLGMAGVGKTVALRGLGHDEEVKKRFSGGVYYMTFGQDATLQTAIAEIASIMKLTGASTQVQNVKSATSLRDAVNYAVTWLQGKICLFLLDDLWPSDNLPKNYFDDLRQLLRGSPLSRMAISTRSVDIASEAGSVVDFGPRHPLGKVSVSMFMSHATGRSNPRSPSAVVQDLRPSVSKILSICGGLPIALAVTGRAVFKSVRVYGTFEKACDACAVKLERKRALLEDKCTGYGASLQVAIELSLEHLKLEFSELLRENSVLMDSSIFDLYTSLCVLSNQAWIPVSVLSRLWKIEEDVASDVASLFAGMSLATRTVRRLSSELPDEAGIVLHDLQLDFCRRRASEMRNFSLWQRQYRYLSGSYDRNLSVWDCKDTAFSKICLIRNISVTGCSALVPTPDHERVIYAAWNALHMIHFLGNEEFVFSSDYESDSGSSCDSSSYGSLDLSKFASHKYYITTLSYARNAHRMVSGSGDGKVQLWDVEKKRMIGEAPTGHTEHMLSVAISSNGKFVIAGSLQGTLHMWKFEGKERTHTSVFNCSHEIRSVCITANGRRAMSSAADIISVWSTRKRKELYNLRGDSHEIFCLDVSENGKYLVSGSRDGTVRLWNLEEKQSQSIFTFSSLVSSVSISSNCLRLASASMDGTTRIFNLQTKAQTGAPIRHPVGDRPRVALNDNGRRLIVSTGEKIAAWAVADSNHDVDQISEEITTLNIT